MNEYQITLVKKDESKIPYLTDLAEKFNAGIKTNSAKDGTSLRFRFETSEEMDQFKNGMEKLNLNLF